MKHEVAVDEGILELEIPGEPDHRVIYVYKI